MTESVETSAKAKGVRQIGVEVAYADGAEGELLDLITEATDFSSRSDELAEAIHDWPTRYHLSRLRSNLLRPLQIPAGTRVLDVGAGTGVMARFLGERGAQVTALEGNPARAEVAAVRCRGLDSVEVLAGDFAALDEDGEYDVVLVVGVLEYVAAGTDDDTGAADFLGRCRSLVSPGGIVVVAIENQVGLKYLLGHPEDHAGEPGVGLEGYPGRSVARTFTRHRLAQLLSGAGLPQQSWLFPFPDYKLPTTVLAEAAYEDAEVLDRLVRDPVRIFDREVDILADARSVHRTLVEAGLGPDVSNSFLVLAGPEGSLLDRWVEPSALGWLLGDERRSQWMRDRVIRTEGAEVRLETDRIDEPVSEAWITQHVERSAPFVPGPGLEQLALEAAARGANDDVTAVLERWQEFLALQEAEMQADPAGNPWAAHPGEAALPGRFLDVNLDNFIVGPDDSIVFVDREWEASSPVAASLVEYRALWYLAVRIITNGVVHPWTAAITVDQLAAEFAARIGLAVDDELRTRWRAAEVGFQALVQGQEEAAIAGALGDLGAAARFDQPGSTGLPFTALRRELTERSAHIAELEEAAARLDAEMRHRQEVIDELASETEHRQEVIDELTAEAERRQETIEGLAAEAQHRLEVIDGLAAEAEHRLRLIREAEADAAAARAEFEDLQRAVDANRLTRFLVGWNQR